MKHCEQCGRQTDYLFRGTLTTKATSYGIDPNSKARKPRVIALGLVDVHRPAEVCQRCRPPSNLEKKEILEEGKYKGQSLELRRPRRERTTNQ